MRQRHSARTQRQSGPIPNIRGTRRRGVIYTEVTYRRHRSVGGFALEGRARVALMRVRLARFMASMGVPLVNFCAAESPWLPAQGEHKERRWQNTERSQRSIYIMSIGTLASDHCPEDSRVRMGITTRVIPTRFTNSRVLVMRLLPELCGSKLEPGQVAAYPSRRRTYESDVSFIFDI